MPLRDCDVDSTKPFSVDELLYRRVLPSEEIEEGEIDPTRFNTISFKAGIDGAPSVLRGQYATALDTIRPECAGGNDVSSQRVYSMRVDELPEVIVSKDGKQYNVFPVHRPEPDCGAHSVIGSCMAGDVERTYTIPSKSARYDLKVKLAAKMKPVHPDKTAESRRVTELGAV